MKSPFFILVCFLVCFSTFYGQIKVDDLYYELALVNHPEVEALRTPSETSFEAIKDMSSWKSYDSTFTTGGEDVIWLKFELKNYTRDTIQEYIFSDEHSVTTFQETASDFKVSKKGTILKPSERSNKHEYLFTAIELLPFQKSLFYVRLKNTLTKYNPGYPKLYSQNGYWAFSNDLRKKQSVPIGFIYFNIIALLTIFVFALVFWLRLRQKLYLYYLGYLFFQIIYGFQVLRPTTATVGNFLAYIPNLSLAFFQPAQFIFIGFYVLFIAKLLTVKKYDKLLANVLIYLGLFCFVHALSQFVLNYYFSGLQFRETLFVIVRSIILPLNLVLIFWIIYKVKHPLLIYFIFGQSFFFIGAVMASYIAIMELYAVPGHFFNFTQSPNIVFQMGLLAEVFCFSLALGENVILLQKEKEKSNQALITQLQENKLSQGKMNRELDEKVQNKTEELIQLYIELEKEKEQKTKNEFTQRIKETEMVALRSQMNPHFIFNSLSALKHLVMTNRNDDAIGYLDDFSILLRSILQNSNRKKITVEEELEILELYLSLEQNRMEADFTYTIQVSSREKLSQYHIPPLLLQPIAENAIWHGLHPSTKAERKLNIIFDTSEHLKIIIEDNGIGRKESAKKIQLHRSMGDTIVKDRLTLYNYLSDDVIRIKTVDLEQENKALGTRVTLTYKH